MSNYTKEIEDKHKQEQEKLLLHKKHNDYYGKIKEEHKLKLRKVKPTPPTDIELAIMAREDSKRHNYLH